MQKLIVWSEGNRVGVLTSSQGKWQFVYDEAWINNKQAYVLSPHFPFQLTPFVDSANDKQVEWFFENLLPEGGMREAMTRRNYLDKNDTLGLLSHYGEELSGALSILHDKVAFPSEQSYLALSQEDLCQMIIDSKDSTLLISNDDLHMSLAGVQNKIGLKYENQQFYLPKGTAASSHILKPENNNSEFPFCPVNEYFCMSLASKMNLNVPEVNLFHLPEAIYLVQRYDRIIENDVVRRLHQIDLCQLLNKWEGYKYESQGGVTLLDVFSVINQLTQPVVARQQILNWFIFNYLIGNSDAHAKNLSFIVKPKSIRVAPLYDLLCIHAYLPNSPMAMYLNNEARLGWYSKDTWQALADIANVPFRYLKNIIKEQVARIDNIGNEAINLKLLTNDENNFVSKKILPVIQQNRGFIKETLDI